MLLLLLSLFVGSSLGQQCPPVNDVLPCSCEPPSGIYSGFGLSCTNPTVATDLTNSRLTEILDKYLSLGITSLSSLSIENAAVLTALPARQLPSFANMESVYIYGSAIQRIPSDGITFSSTGSSLQIRNNEISALSDGAFQGVYTGVSSILMDGNKLTRLNENNFAPLVEGTGDLDISKNPIDCVTDKCHLAWLIRDLPVSNVAYRNVIGSCSNGTSFAELNPRAYQDCPTKLFTCPSDSGLYANPYDPCGQVFFQCSGGNAYFQYCSPGLAFNPDGYCDYIGNVPGCQ